MDNWECSLSLNIFHSEGFIHHSSSFIPVFIWKANDTKSTFSSSLLQERTTAGEISEINLKIDFVIQTFLPHDALYVFHPIVSLNVVYSVSFSRLLKISPKSHSFWKLLSSIMQFGSWIEKNSQEMSEISINFTLLRCIEVSISVGQCFSREFWNDSNFAEGLTVKLWRFYFKLYLILLGFNLSWGSTARKKLKCTRSRWWQNFF